MKKRLIPILSTALALTAVAWSAIAISADDSATVDKSTAELVARMDHQIKEVEQRVHMSAPMELRLENGRDPIAEAVASGFIIETTLEEVEAALAAAAATPEPEDDQRAMALKHRGSYRFFSPSSERAAGRTAASEQ